MVSPAHYTCSNLLEAIKCSQLDFLLQETPYSVFLTIRKKYVKNFKSANKDENLENERVTEDLKQENENLRNVAKEMTIKNEANENKVSILEKKLKKAEEDMLKHLENETIQKVKLTDEINVLKNIKKKDNDNIARLTTDLSKCKGELKALQKALTNTEKKSENLENKVENLNARKCDIEKEKGKLMAEVKSLKRTIKHLEEETYSNNNNIALSTSSSPSICLANASSQTTSPLKCLICGKLCTDSFDLKTHSEADHALSIDIEKLEDLTENDPTSRFINSMNVDPDYLLKRRTCFPDHWDHIDERNKVRMVAKLNFADKSARIERNMKQVDFINNVYKGTSFETSML